MVTATTVNCKIGKTYAPDYSKLDAWALAGLHLKARNAGDKKLKY